MRKCYIYERRLDLGKYFRRRLRAEVFYLFCNLLLRVCHLLLGGSKLVYTGCKLVGVHKYFCLFRLFDIYKRLGSFQIFLVDLRFCGRNFKLCCKSSFFGFYRLVFEL